MASEQTSSRMLGEPPPLTVEERLAQFEALLASQQREISAQHEEIAQLRAPVPVVPVVPMPSPLSLVPAVPEHLAGELAPGAIGDASDAPTNGKRRRGRRALLKLGGAAAAAGVAAVAAVAASASELTRPGTAHAHFDTSAIFTSSTAAVPACEGDGTSGAAGVVGNSDSNTGVYGHSSTYAGVYGATDSTNSAGVFGISSATNASGVTGLSSIGTGVFGTSTGGTGVWGSSSTGTGAVGRTTGGLAGVFGDASGGTTGDGVHGASNTHSGVWGSSNSGYGVDGTTVTGRAGTHGVNAGTGFGVVGEATNGSGVLGYSVNSYGGVFQGGLAPLALTTAASPGPPSAGLHWSAEFYVDSNGILWYSVKGNGTDAGVWVRLTGPLFGVPGGVLNYLAAPIRIFDSRVSSGAPLPAVKGVLAGQSTTTIQVTGTTVGGLSVPAGAVGVFGNLTVTNTQGPGDLILWPHGAPQPITSNINYGPGQTVANSANIGLSSDGKMDLFVHVSGTDVLFDVAGYVV